MSETTETTTEETTPPEPAKAETANDWTTVFEGKSPQQVKDEIDKWKHFSRKNEDELNELRKANMTEAERAIEEAKAQGRAEAEAAFQAEKLNLQLAKAAAEVGVPEDVLNLVDPTKLVVNGEIQTELLSSLAAPKGPQFTKSASDLGLGAQTSSGAGQLTQADLRRMSPKEINEAREAGKLNDLMSGRLK